VHVCMYLYVYFPCWFPANKEPSLLIVFPSTYFDLRMMMIHSRVLELDKRNGFHTSVVRIKNVSDTLICARLYSRICHQSPDRRFINIRARMG
jgi:hypothetical protein